MGNDSRISCPTYNVARTFGIKYFDQGNGKVGKNILFCHLTPESIIVSCAYRSIHSARHVFNEYFYQSGKMKSVEYALLDSWYQFLNDKYTTGFDLSGDLICKLDYLLYLSRLGFIFILFLQFTSKLIPSLSWTESKNVEDLKNVP